MELSGIAVLGQAIGGDKRKLDGFPASNYNLYSGLWKNAVFADETLCLTYKNAKGKTKKVRFGLLLNEGQQEFVIKRIRELCAENFGKE